MMLTKLVATRISPIEYNKILADCKSNGQSVSKYVRHLIVNDVNEVKQSKHVVDNDVNNTNDVNNVNNPKNIVNNNVNNANNINKPENKSGTSMLPIVIGFVLLIYLIRRYTKSLSVYAPAYRKDVAAYI